MMRKIKPFKVAYIYIHIFVCCSHKKGCLFFWGGLMKPSEEPKKKKDKRESK